MTGRVRLLLLLVAGCLVAATATLPGTALAADRPTPSSVASSTPSPTDTPRTDAPTDDDATEATEDGVAVQLLQVSPPVVDAAATLTVRTRVTNPTTQVLPAGTEVDLRVQRSQLSTRASVRDWTDQDLDGAVGSLVVRQQLVVDLAPGGQVAVDFAVAATELQLDPSGDDWGPRGVSVLVRAPDGTRIAVARTQLVWFPAAVEALPTSVSVLLPLSGGVPDPATGVVAPDVLASLVEAGAPLDAVLTAAATPGVTLALDPSLVAGTTPDSAAGAAGAPGAAVRAWTTRLQQSTAAGGAVLLPYGDADLAALAHAGVSGLAQVAQEQARDVAQRVLPAAVRTDVAWPADGDLDPEALGALRALGYTSVVLAESAVPAEDAGPTPTGRVDLEVDGQVVTGLVSDTGLSRALAAVGDGTDGTDGTDAQPTPAAAVQQLLAETAAVTLERPRDPRHLLVTAPRDWAPTEAAALAAVQALVAVPWVAPAGLTELVDTPAPDVERAALTGDRADELPAAGLRRLEDDLVGLRSLATALTEPRSATDPAERAAVALTSTSWRDDPEGWAAGVDALAATRAALHAGVRVVPGSAVTQVSREVQLPVTVQNTLAEDVSVVLAVRSTSSRLVITRDVSVDVAAGQTEVAFVPVRGVGSGEATVVSQLRAPSGDTFDRPVETRVRVRADWESRGTLAMAVVAGLVLVGGLTRTIVRGRPRRGRDPLATPDGAGGTDAQDVDAGSRT